MIIDSNYQKFNINKLPRNKETQVSGNGAVTINNSNMGANGNSFEPHYLWGQYFNDTRDITGDIVVDGDVKFSGNINYIGSQGSQGNGNITANRITVDTGTVRYLNSTDIANSNNINTNSLNAQTIVGAQGNIASLISDEISVRDLTVTGQAHFFELIIDKISSVGGSVMLTPADGFNIDKVDVNATYGTQGTQGIKLLWLAEDGDNEASSNMWEVDDQLLIMDFNRATTGTQHSASNRYFWGLVKAVSGNDPEIIVENDLTHTYHYVIVDKTDYVGTLPNADYVGASAVMCGNRTNADRQNVIYINSSDTSLDANIKPPFIAMYRGVQGYALSNNERYSWLASGGLNGVASNQIKGNLLVESLNENIVDYVDDKFNSVDIEQYTVELETNQIFVNAEYNSNTGCYEIVGSQGQWSTNVAVYYNGNPISDIPYIQSGVNGVTFTPNDDRTGNAHYRYLITIPQSVFPTGYNWPGLDPFEIPITLKWDPIIGGGYSYERNITIYVNKILKGDNGSATAVHFGLYDLVPVTETAEVDAQGNMKMLLNYQLGSVDVQSDGTTTVTALTNWDPSFSVKFTDDKNVRVAETLDDVYSGSVITNKKKDLTGVTPNPYYLTDYITRLGNNTAPTYITAILYDGSNNEMARRIVPITMFNGAVFDLTSDKITLAVAQSEINSAINTNNTSLGLNDVSNRVSNLTVGLQGIQGTVSNLNTTVNNQGTAIQNQSLEIAQLSLGYQGVQSTVQQINNDYLSSSAFQSQINQTAQSITQTVTSNIDGELQTTGIYISTGEINVKANKFTVTDDNDNIILGAQGNAFLAKDVVFDNCNITNKLNFKDADKVSIFAQTDDGVDDLYINLNNTNNNDCLVKFMGFDEDVSNKMVGLVLGDYNKSSSMGKKQVTIGNDGIYIYNNSGSDMNYISLGFAADGEPQIKLVNGVTGRTKTIDTRGIH